MKQSITLNPARSFFTSSRSFFPDLRSALLAGAAVAALAAMSVASQAQTQIPGAPPESSQPAATTPAAPTTTLNLSNEDTKKTKAAKEDKVVQSKDTKKEVKRYKKDNPLEGVQAKLPDKELYDKAMNAIKRGQFDVARLDLQTLLNTYPESQFMMRSKLAIADAWFKEGGTASLTQAEQEYRDFITFFPNQPEAAEAQMRIGDIYFKWMDKPDRDSTKALRAEQEYRTMLQQFPDSPRVPEAEQRLREVQEFLATSETDVADEYVTRLNWPAAIARYQTVVDQYPLYSHMDEVLIGLGDAYEQQAKAYRAQPACTTEKKTACMPEGAKGQLEKLYDDTAADYYRKVVMEHAAAPHVEDARDRLSAMNVSIPTPTPEQVAMSEKIENSRGQYTLTNRVSIFVLHKADTVPAATVGDAPLEDAKRTVAPTIVRESVNNYTAAMTGKPLAVPAGVQTAHAQPAAQPAMNDASQAGSQTGAAMQPQTTPTSPLAFQDVPNANAQQPATAVAPMDLHPAAVAPSASTGVGGIEIVQPGTAAPVTTVPAQPLDSNYGVKAVGPDNTTLAPIEKAADGPAPVNDITPGTQPATQAKPADAKKNPKPTCDKKDESCSTHKPKKGLNKLNPF